MYEELATLQADASEARGSSRIKRLASTPRRMVRVLRLLLTGLINDPTSLDRACVFLQPCRRVYHLISSTRVFFPCFLIYAQHAQLAGMLTPRRKRAAVTRMAAPPSLEDAFAEADAEIEMRQTMPSSAPPKAKSAARTPRQPLGSVNSTVRLLCRAYCDALGTLLLSISHPSASPFSYADSGRRH